MRQHIRAAAIRVIRRLQLSPGDVRGYEQITIRDVINEAGISIGTFYKYFENRSDLGQSLWAEPVEKLRADMQHDFDQAQGATEKVRLLLEHYVRFSQGQRRVFKGAFLFVRPDGNTAPVKTELKDEPFYKNLCTAFLEGQASGVFRDFDAHAMAQLFWAAIHGALALPVNLDRYNFDDVRVLSANMIDELLALIRY